MATSEATLPSLQQEFGTTLRAIEATCDDFQVPSLRAAAERQLLAFRETRGIHDCALFIYEHSNHILAKYHAANAVATSILRDPPPVNMANDLIHRLIFHAIKGNFSGDVSVKQGLWAAAAIAKRYYQEQSQMPWSAVEQLVHAANGESANTVFAFAFARALLDVFSDVKVGPSPIFHAQCQAHFQGDDLSKILSMAVSHIVDHTPRLNGKPDASTASRTLLLAIAMEILELCLSWDFCTPEVLASGGTYYGASAASELAEVKLPAAWADTLLRKDFLQAVFFLLSFTAYSRSTVLFNRGIQCANILCRAPGLTLTVKAGHSASESPAVHFCTEIVRGLQLLLQQLSKQFNGPLFQGISEIMRRLYHHFPIGTVLSAVPGFLEFLNAVGQLTVLSTSLQGNSEDEKQWLEEAGQELLAVWACVGSESLRLQSENLLAAPFVAQLSQIANQIVKAFVVSKATPDPRDFDDNDSYNDAEGFKDWDVYEDMLMDISSLARMDAATNAVVLTNMAQQLMSKASNIKPEEMTAHYEATHWLLMIIGSFLSDKAENEVVLIPSQVLVPSAGTPGAIRSLCETFLNLFDSLCSNPSMTSPTVLESLWWSIDRFFQCYVCPDASEYSSQHASSPILSAFGPERLQQMVGRASSMLQCCSGETGVLDQVIRVILTVSRIRGLRTTMVHLPEFYILAREFLSRMHGFPDSIYSGMTEAIVRIGTSCSTKEGDHAGHDLVMTVMSTISSEFQALSHTGDLQAPHNLTRITRCLEMLNGVSRSTDLSNVSTLSPSMRSFFEAFPSFLNRAGSISELWIYVLDILVHFAEGDIPSALDDLCLQVYLAACVSVSCGYSKATGASSASVISHAVLEEEARATIRRILNLMLLLGEDRDHPPVLAALIVIWTTLSPQIASRDLLDNPGMCTSVSPICHVLVEVHQARIKDPLEHTIPIQMFSSNSITADTVWKPLVEILIHLVQRSNFPIAVEAGLEIIALLDPTVCPGLVAYSDQLLAILVQMMHFHPVNTDHRDLLGKAIHNLGQKRYESLMALGQHLIGQHPAVHDQLSVLLSKLFSALHENYPAFQRVYFHVFAESKRTLPQTL